MPAKAKKEEKAHKLPELGQENYDVWEMHVKHCFYAADWLGMYEASQVHYGVFGEVLKTSVI